jgi:hypothetical protein
VDLINAPLQEMAMPVLLLVGWCSVGCCFLESALGGERRSLPVFHGTTGPPPLLLLLP